MARFTVYVHFEGCVPLEVDAEDENKACEIAENSFGELSDEEICNQIADTSCDVQTI